MEYDGKILNYIWKNEYVSQRELAKYLDLSLGQTNLLLHNLAKKGFLEIKKINSRNLRYILTPQGIASNIKRTYNYIVNAINHVLSLKELIVEIVEDYDSKGYTVYLNGKKDEIYQLLKQVISDKKLSQVKWLYNIEELIETDEKALVVVWDNENEELYKEHGIEYINLLSRIDCL